MLRQKGILGMNSSHTRRLTDCVVVLINQLLFIDHTTIDFLLREDANATSH